MLNSPFFSIVSALDPNNYKNDDEKFFVRALQNAQYCQGSTHPNPSVGAVLVKDDQIIAEGYTHPVGGMHAEKHTLTSAGERARGATLYVTLEPCSHFGRTPPCTKAIIEAGIKRVVFGTCDPNPLVNGSGITELVNAGIEVTLVENRELRAMADAFLRHFTCWLVKKRPLVLAKIATTADNKISSGSGARTKITNYEADAMVHALRQRSDAIMVGGSTARIDNPQLTARIGSKQHNRQPWRIILTAQQDIDDNLSVFNTSEAKTVLMTGEDADVTKIYQLKARGVDVVTCKKKDNQLSLPNVFETLGSLGITTVLVETGKNLFETLITNELADEVWWFRAQELLPKGVYVNVPGLLEHFYKLVAQYPVGDNQLLIWQKKR
jgi:diaminohydroxyphosphoribosylaminopyrimidine deaminase/5-amino-6-(5-phosphoribosylamino)uracil reductase